MMLYTKFNPTQQARALGEQLSRIHRALAPYAGLDDPQMAQFRRHVLAQSVHYSTRIEGNTLSLNQVEDLVSGKPVNAPEQQAREAQNCKEALDYAATFALDGGDVTEETIRTLHFLVSKGLNGYNPGRYRVRQTFVTERLSGRQVFLPPEPKAVPGLVAELAEFINGATELDPIHRAGLVHLNLAAIHPFEDGNGPTARVLETLTLLRGGVAGGNLAPLEAYFGQATQGYYEALAAALGPSYSPDRDVSGWLEYYLRAHATQSRGALGELLNHLSVVSGLKEAFPSMAVNGSMAVVSAVGQGTISNQAYRAITGYSPQNAALELKRLVDGGILEQRGKGRGAHYALAPQTAEVIRQGAAAGQAKFEQWVAEERGSTPSGLVAQQPRVPAGPARTGPVREPAPESRDDPWNHLRGDPVTRVRVQGGVLSV